MSAKLAAFPRFKALDQNAGFLAGGKLFSFIAGTSTPKPTYSDQSGTVANQNPVILDGAGEADVWLTTGAYKFLLTDANDVPQWTVDNIEVQQADLESDSLTTNTIEISGQLTSTITGLAPFIVASNIKVANLNADLLDGNDWASPGAIGSVTPSTGVFTTIKVNSSADLVKVSGLNADLLDSQDWDSTGPIGNSTPAPARFTKVDVIDNTAAALGVGSDISGNSPLTPLNATKFLSQTGCVVGVAVDFPSIGAATRGSVNVTITGAKITANSLVVAMSGYELLPDDLIYIGCKATGTDTVTLYAYNPTGGSIDAGSVSFTFAIFGFRFASF